MSPEDLYELRWVADPRLSPDATTVAYVDCAIDRAANDYVTTIWTVPVDDSRAAAPLTPGDAGREATPRWSPDGQSIAFTSTRGEEPAQLLVVDARDGATPRKLTDLPEDVAEITWSPDGKSIAFSSRVRDAAYDETDERRRGPRRFRRLQFKLDNVGWTGDRRQHIFSVPADGSAPARQLTFGDYEDATPTWSPDGSHIAFISNRDDDWDLTIVRDVYSMDAGGGEPRRLTDGQGIAELPAWSPDGTLVSFQLTPGEFDEPRHARIAVVDPATGTVTTLTDELDRNCGPYPAIREPQWTQTSSLIFGVEDHGNTHLYEVDVSGGRPKRLVGGDLTVTGWDAAGSVLVHTRSTPTALPELYIGNRRATYVQSGFSEAREIAPVERFTAVSHDGAEVEAWIMAPPGFTGAPAPVLLNIHGGPFAQYGNRFFDEFQVQAGAGYVVLYANPRGSSGYSEEWGRAIRGPGAEGPGMGSVDYDDVMAVLDTALELYPHLCDRDRLGVLGGSYGGYLTSWIVAHTNRFKAACSERAVNDWPSMHGSSDEGWAFKGYTGAFLFEDPEAWRAMSPTTHATSIDTPLLIMHSENDLRCNIEQAEQLFTTLRLLKKDVELVRWPAESHELTRSGSPAHRVARFEILLEWFDRYLAESPERSG